MNIPAFIFSKIQTFRETRKKNPSNVNRLLFWRHCIVVCYHFWGGEEQIKIEGLYENI